MDFLSSPRQHTPSGSNAYFWVAVVIIVVVLLGDVLFFTRVVFPQMRANDKLASELAAAEQQLVEAEKVQQSPEELQEQLTAAQAALEEKANAFLSESQGAEVLNKLYRYAEESDVEIISLQSEGGAAPEAQEGEEEGEGGKSAYDVNVFRLQVEGLMRGLMDFISRIEEAKLDSFAISDVSIAGGGVNHILTMNVTLYTSSYSSGTSGQIGPMPTPVSLAQLEEALAKAWAAKDWKRAIDITNQILIIDSSYAGMVDKLYSAYVNYGYQLLEEGNKEGAATQFKLALEVIPGGAEATAGLQRASVTPTPTLDPEAQLRRSLDEAWAAEDWEEVISLVEQLLEIHPDGTAMTEKLYAAYVNYGYQLAGKGKLEEAKEAFSRALEINPDGEEAKEGLQALADETLPPTPGPEPEYIIHVVQPGENLFRIALRYGTTVNAIMAANGMSDTTIYVGQQLRIPVQ